MQGLGLHAQHVVAVALHLHVERARLVGVGARDVLARARRVAARDGEQVDEQLPGRQRGDVERHDEPLAALQPQAVAGGARLAGGNVRHLAEGQGDGDRRADRLVGGEQPRAAEGRLVQPRLAQAVHELLVRRPALQPLVQRLAGLVARGGEQRECEQRRRPANASRHDVHTFVPPGPFHRGGLADARSAGMPRGPPGPVLASRAMSATAAIRDQLRGMPFLEGLPDSAFHQLAKLVEPASYPCDAFLFEEGNARRMLALLTSGAVAIEKTTNGRPVRLVTLGAGEAVGEGLLLDDAPHGTSARVLQPVKAYVVTAPMIEQMLRETPALYAALVGRAARVISRRLAATDATLVGRFRTLGFGGHRTRTEHDLLGEREVPFDALYGVQSLRAQENFAISGLRPLAAFVDALVWI